MLLPIRINIYTAKRINISPEKCAMCKWKAYQDKYLCGKIFIRRNISSVNATSNLTQVYDALLDDLTQVRVASDDGFVSS